MEFHGNGMMEQQEKQRWYHQYQQQHIQLHPMTVFYKQAAQTYSVVATNTLALCNMDMATSNGTNLTITENPSPIVNAGIDQTGCEGIIFNLNATGASTYVWNAGSTAAGISVSPASTSTYSVTGIINATGCTATDAVIVNVNPLPLKYTVSGDGDYFNDIHYICDSPGQKKITIRCLDNDGAWSQPQTIYFMVN